ncbi:MAG: hypothetical protein QF619_04855 [Candidatus Binatia bacterium]|jgi:hypothetical protein|nr:hypothetical protein [Candidatus Binatia bacterium]
MECKTQKRPRLSGEYLSYEALIRAEASDSLTPGPVDKECEWALNAFIAGEYMIVINDQRIHDLETRITLDPDSRIEFIKILPLVGG